MTPTKKNGWRMRVLAVAIWLLHRRAARMGGDKTLRELLIEGGLWAWAGETSIGHIFASAAVKYHPQHPEPIVVERPDPTIVRRGW